MKNMSVLLVVMWLLAALVRSFEPAPSTLELRIFLTEGGPNIAPQLRTYVGYVSHNSSGHPTLGNIVPLQPNEGTESVYEVPENRRIGIFVLSKGVSPFQSAVTVESRQHLVHDFILNAGIVQVSIEHTQNTFEPNIWVLDSDGQFDTNDRFVDGVEFMLPAGSQVFQIGSGLGAKRVLLDVIAGHTHYLNIAN